MTKRPVMLIADDAPTNRLMLKKIFGDAYVFIDASDGLEALHVLRERDDIGIILLDLRMPHLDGFGVLDALKKDPRLADIPVIVNTAEVGEQNEVTSLQLGAVDFITKPYNPEIVRQRVRSILHKRELDAIHIENSRLKAEARTRALLEYHATHDALTGIYNRGAFYEKTASLLRANPDKKYALLRWDIERFKVINDLFGKEMGDRLLKGIAEQLRQKMKNHGTYGRLEADHFVICLPADLVDPEDFVRSLDAVYGEFHLNYNIISNIGIYLIDDIATPVDLMCDRANLALRTIKGNYVKRYAYYDGALRSSLLMEQQLCGEMDEALKKRQFHVYFQPIYDVSTNAPVSAEALVRWQHPERGLVSPGVFIPLFERNGFISKLDAYIWEEVCRYQHESLESGRKVVPVSVNISRIDLYNPHLSSIFIALVTKYHIPPSLLKLEITESAYNDNPRQLLETMEELQKYGFKMLMDDFGSGYSSLNMLKDVPVDILKVDMRFLEDLETSKRAGSVLTSVVRMAKWLEMEVVAEGVETRNQLDFLRGIGCDMVQGYYFSKPLPEETFTALLARQAMAKEQLPQTSPDDIDFNSLWNSSREVNLLFNEMIDCIGFMELSNGRLEAVRVNDGFYRLFNTSPHALFDGNKNVLDRIYPEDRQLLLRVCTKAEHSSCSQKVCLRHLSNDGSFTWLSVAVRHIGKKIHQSLFYFAISELKKTEEDNVSAPPRKARMLVVDDIFANRAVLCEEFRLEADVLEACNGQEALRMLDEDASIDLVLLDLEMPVINGFEVLEHMQRSSALCEIPVVVMTAHGEEDNELKALQLGATEFIEKPYNPGIVLQRVRNVLRKREVDRMRVENILMRQDKERSYLEVTEKLQEQAEEINQQLKALNDIYSSMPCGIADVTRVAPYRVLDYNDACVAAYGHVCRESFEHEQVGNFLNNISQEDRFVVEQASADCLTGDKKVSYAVRVLRKGGGFGHLFGWVSPGHMLDGTPSLRHVFLDVTEAKEKEKALLRAEALRGTLVEASDLLILEYDCHSDVMLLSHLNSKGEREEVTLGDYLHDKQFANRLSQESLEDYVRQMELCRRRPLTGQIEVTLKTGDAFRHYRIFFKSFTEKDGSTVERIVGIGKNLDAAACALEECDEGGMVAMASAFSVNVFDLESDEIQELHSDHAVYFTAREYSRSGSPLIHADDAALFEENLSGDALRKAYAGGRNSAKLQYRLRNRAGEWVWVETDAHLTRNSKTGHLCAFISTAQTAGVSDLARRASRDALTGLYNRAALQEKVDSALQVCPQGVFLLYDVDNLAHLNENGGRQQEEALLMHVASLLKQTFRSMDIIGRIGGDEFAVLLCGASSDMPFDRIADDTLGQINSLSEMLGLDCRGRAALGFAAAPHDGQNFDTLYHKAAKSLFNIKAGHAKLPDAAGKNS